MFSYLKKVLLAGLMVGGLLALPVVARAVGEGGGHYGSDSAYHPTWDGGNFGVGLEFGNPGTWGIAGKVWVDRVNAFAPTVKFNEFGTVILQFDYLWHNFDIIHPSNGELPLYIGLGGNLVLLSTVDVAARLPVGISYIFDKKNLPIDIYLQAVPTLWFFPGGLTTFDVYGELGAHFYL